MRLLTAFILIFCLAGFADDKEDIKDLEDSEPIQEVEKFEQIKWAKFQLSFMSVFQSANGNTQTLHFAWAPYFPLSEPFGLRGDFGVAFMKSALGDIFLATNYEALLTARIMDLLEADFGGGMVIWHGNGEAQGVMSLSVAALTSVVEPFLGYSHIFIKGRPAEVLRAGVRAAL